jgi:tetratricopeptide (TPR) repeat protein
VSYKLIHVWSIGLTLVLLSGPLACKRQEPTEHTEPSPPQPTAAASTQSLQFIEDDYERALKLANERKLPVFVDVWASWCHTCLSMKQYVLTDPVLSELASSFVWLAIDAERRDNAAFLKRFPTRNMPTLWVIEPGTQTPVLKWIGAATAHELKDVLHDALRDRSGQLALQPEAAGEAEVNTLWLRAQHASASGDGERAIKFYTRALEVAPAGWAHRARAVEALSMRLAESDQAPLVIELAAREAPNMATSTARLNVVLNAIDASEQLPAEAPQRAALPSLIALGTSLAETPTPQLLLDDRSSLYLSLITVQKHTKPEEAQRLARAWSSALDAQAARETEPARRRVWDPHRVEAYLALEQPERAVPMLEQSEREAPDDYNAAARLARVYLTLKNLPDARAAIDRALPLAQGPRKLRLFTLKADILQAAGDNAAARGALQEAVQFGRSSQLPAQFDKQLATLERRAGELGTN